MIVLRPGVEGNRNLGTHAVPGLYVKFQGGTLEVKEDTIVEMLRNHPSYGVDFLEIKHDEIDPFLHTREEIEPDHVIHEIEYGHVGKAKGSPVKTKLTPAMKKVIEGEALKMIPGLLKQNPEILKNIILDLASEMKKREEKTETKEDKPIEKKA
jgi:hypothetical protein